MEKNANAADIDTVKVMQMRGKVRVVRRSIRAFRRARDDAKIRQDRKDYLHQAHQLALATEKRKNYENNFKTLKIK